VIKNISYRDIDHLSLFVDTVFLEMYSCYKPSVFQASKMFGFDFHTYLTDMIVSNGNVQFLWHALPKDKVEMCCQAVQKMK